MNDPQASRPPDAVIRPADYRPPGAFVPPPPAAPGPPQRNRPGALALALGVLVILLALAAGFALTARSVAITTTPAAERLAVRGGLAVPLGNRWLLRPGSYRVEAEATGHAPLDAELIVEDTTTEAQFPLMPLPGRLSLRSTPAAEVAIDGQPLGTTPIDGHALNRGSHRLRFTAARHQPLEQAVEIEGYGREQTVSVTLVQAWAPVTFSSQPAGASVWIDGRDQGRTPLTLELGAGRIDVEFRLAGHKTRQLPVTVVANQPQSLPTVTLAPADATIRVETTPPGAQLSVDGAARGKTPLSVSVSPDVEHRLSARLDGHEPAETRLALPAEGSRSVQLTLKPILGSLAVRLTPADATLLVDGREQMLVDGQLTLTATRHRIEARKPGHRPFAQDVTIRSGVAQRLDIRLPTEAEAKAAANPPLISSATIGLRLRQIGPGSFTMGTPRSDQGRQANEVQRAIRLTRPFYLATTEITNAQFRQFRSGHSSGIVARASLDNDSYPAVRVGWDDAVAFCNWLSRQDGLPPAYNADGSLVTPATTGYRLPTEAEWEWAARFHGAGSPRRYPWGDAMPPPPDSGNFADARAGTLVNQILEGYDDGFAATAPTGKGRPIPPGLYDLGGNVSEWVHDRYDGALVPSLNPQTDPTGPASGGEHVVRGSSWRHGRITELRLAWRDHAREPRDDLGFRIARHVE